ncbi:Mur ligase family protein [Polaromonas eurypsychrophila]|uniref:UDP-N-acetylmuramoylalanine--D-glutamate ligase n=1 Tax=Polaromonas eurypsychrophila TaxID=1614635 RepID=A0A916WGG2_9BURK|nr:UDP-N-acetylmuramoyl-L-alanine--D-glutamate ligase [Polaromonas eurypsychrophila]GGA95210.1 UDP-N-acetylmuramoylalanine--D-glutamate ligase [Polaromonas eurypsychrophila]
MNVNDPLNPGDMPDPLPVGEGTAVPAPLPVAAVDVAPELPASAMAEPVVETAAPRPPAKGGPRPLPDTLTAARDAAAFVTQLFAEVSVPDNAPPVPENLVSDAAADGQVEDEPDTSGEITADPLHGQHVLVLGLGASGLAMARWCVRMGARVAVVDTREAPPQLAGLQADLPQVAFSAGAFEAGLIEGSDIRAVFKSPGLSPEAVEPVMSAAQAQGLLCGNELSLFAQALVRLAKTTGYTPQVLAITGTNGKTTTTALTGQLVAHAGKTVAVAGNIGPSMLDTLARHIDAGTLPEVWVLELSSFQLDGVQGFEPAAATVLNLTQDHLDWHGSMAAYGAAKARIFGSRGLLVLNRDDPAVMAMLPSVGEQKIPPVRVKLQKPRWREYLSFGLGMPERPGDFGIEIVNGMAWLVRAAEADETVKKKRPHAALPPEGAVHALGRPGGVQYKDEEVVLHIQRLMPVEAMRLRGRHNATNALAALALAGAVGGTMASMLHGLRDYAGEPHRVTPVAVVHDVEYFDDSKGTNVGATVAALTGLGAERKLVLIAGGDGKGQDFSPLADPVRRYARAVVLIGRDASLIRAALEGTGVSLLDADSMQAAVALAAHQAQTGDAVLMSPACASFDMFDNYGHRAQVFCDAVRSLASDAGGVS